LDQGLLIWKANFL